MTLNSTTTRPGRLEGRVALITGGTSGIGQATALLFAREGVTVVITGRRTELGEAVVAEIEAAGGRASFIAADHTRAEDCRRVVETVIASENLLKADHSPPLDCRPARAATRSRRTTVRRWTVVQPEQPEFSDRLQAGANGG